jgi:hypothetical protein
MNFTPTFDQFSPGLVTGYERVEAETVLVGGLPRLAASLPPPLLPAQSNLVDLDSLAADLNREGFCLWLRHDGEEFAVELLCSVDVLPGPWPRPQGRGVTAAEAIAAAVKEKVRIVGEFRKAKKA